MPFRKAFCLGRTIVKRYELAGDVDRLLPMLEDEDWEVRRAAARALGNLGDSRAIEPLKDLSDDKERKVRYTANLALNKLDKTPENA